MSLSGDNYDEMRMQRTLDDETMEMVLSSRPTAGGEGVDDLTWFVEGVRWAATGQSPRVGPQLAAILAEGLTTDKGDLPATAASNVPGPAEQVAGLPKRRRKQMLETILAKAFLAKAAAVLGGLTIATSGAAAADLLPGSLQDHVAVAVEKVSPLDLPDSNDEAKDKRRDAEHRADDKHVADERDPKAEDNFGSTVSNQAPEAPKADGRAFGQTVSSNAPKAPQAETARTRRPSTPAAGNPGTTNRSGAGRPAATPTAPDNPGSDHRPSTTPTAEQNPGTGYRR